MERLRYKTMAKVNLGLDVRRRRPDGYHEVKMVMQTVGLYDTLEMVRLEEDAIRVETNRRELPADEGNLIYRAAARLKEAYGLRGGIAVSLTKNIPMAAGMAGGSADAAATLAGMNRLFGLGLSLEQLQRVGVAIGADVPYCLMGGTVLAEGIGEVLTPLPAVPAAHLVIAKPDVDISTKFVYENLHADRLSRHPDMDGMVDCIRRHDLAGMAARMENVLETVTVKVCPVIEEMKAFLRREGALNAMMSGSGPTVFGVFETETGARSAYKAMRGAGFTEQVFLTEFVQETCVEEGVGR